MGLVIVPDEIHPRRGHVTCTLCKALAPSLDGEIYECVRCSAHASRTELQLAFCGTTTLAKPAAVRMRDILARITARGYRA